MLHGAWYTLLVIVSQARGFTLLQHRSAVTNFHHLADIENIYYGELLHLAQSLTQADAVAVASHVLRSVGDVASSDKPGVRHGAFMAHGDFSDSFKSQLLDMMHTGQPCIAHTLGITMEQLAAGRLIILNLWRPLSTEPVAQAPLAVCDATTIAPRDLFLYAHDPQPPPQNYQLPLPNILTIPAPSAAHRWCD